MQITTWSPGEEDYLSAWHQAAARMNPFLPSHPHPVVRIAHDRGADIGELMLLHDCFIKGRNPLMLLERELDEIIPWPWSVAEYRERIAEVRKWASIYYAPKTVEITAHASAKDHR